MASFSVDLKIESDMFPEIGNPLSVKPAKEAKPSRNLRGEYVSYSQAANLANEFSIRKFRNKNPELLEVDVNKMNLKFDYEKETSKTYKFLGMDIDEDYNAVIKIGNGHVVVGSLFDKEEILKEVENNFNHVLSNVVGYSVGSYRFKEELIKRKGEFESLSKSLKLAVEGLSKDTVRELSTALKTGVAYDMADRNAISSGLDLDIVNDKLLEKLNVSSSGGFVSDFKSILLNLVNQKNIERADARGDYSQVNLILLTAILNSWCALAKKYSGMYSSLACMDLWSNLDKKLVGEDVFYDKMRQCISVTNNDSGEVSNEIISFAGVAKNGSASDDNVVRQYSSDALREISECILTGNFNYCSADFSELLMGFADLDGVDDIYSVSNKELQALSVLDSLQYIDEDATLCKESYDLNNPEERGLFVKSSIRSYERNFKEFKPAHNYDVTEALADMVDRGDIASTSNIVPETEVVGSEEDDSSVVVTDNREGISSTQKLKDLQRVMKLVFKATSKISEAF